MAITDRTRKILWGRSGNLCAFCRRVLIEEKTQQDEESVVGDECHIIGERPTAARGEFGAGREDLDEYDNLILLCKVHHKLVDDQPETYPTEKLRELKSANEQWVRDRLSRQTKGSPPRVVFLPRLVSGRDLASVVGGAHAFAFDHEELETQAETELVAGFLQNLQDWGDLWPSLESGQHVEARFTLTGSLREIEAAGMLVFGARERKKMRMKTNNDVFDWEVATITIVRSTNAGITALGSLATMVEHAMGSGAP
ncbi:HNH endonuclease [bacterium]|nr:HNH endonuclease [bacterium]